MALPSSGTITLQNLQTTFGGTNPIYMSEYYRGGAYVPSQVRPLNIIPTSGTLALSHFYGSPANPVFGLSGGFASTCGNGVWTPAAYIYNYFPPTYRTAGRSFNVVTRLQSCTSWPSYPTLTGYFSYGTSGQVQSPTVTSKQWYMRIYYTAPDTIQGYGFYSGESTNYPNGGLYIDQINF